MPIGVITFVSATYEGLISGRKLIEVSGLLELLDEIIVEKGFQIQDLLAPLGLRLNVPPFLNSNTQMPKEDVLLTRKIAHLRRVIGRVKLFCILQTTIPADSLNEVIHLLYVD